MRVVIIQKHYSNISVILNTYTRVIAILQLTGFPFTCSFQYSIGLFVHANVNFCTCRYSLPISLKKINLLKTDTVSLYLNFLSLPVDNLSCIFSHL